MNKLLAALALMAGAHVHAATPASEAQWIAAAEKAVAFAQARGMPVALEVQAGAGLSGHTPIGMWSESGRCTLIVSARGNPTADKVSSMVDPALVDLFLEGAAMHEIGHCHRRLHGYPHNEKLLPVVAWMAPVKSWFTRRILTEEAYADMTEVAWLARYHPQRFAPLLQEIVKVRTRFREPKHDTLPWLHSAIAQGPQDSGEDLFLLADKHLLRYR
jgi:hypothetical protein